MNWSSIRAHLLGALKSWTVWFSALLAALPEILPLVRDNFGDFAPFIPLALQSHAMQVIALLITVLRIKTNTSLAQK